MKLIYVTSGMGIHNMAISDSYYKILGPNFSFVETRKPSDVSGSIHKHAEIGKDYQNKCYLVRGWESGEAKIKAITLINNADVVIFGGFSFDYVKERLNANKLTFCSSERWFKRPFCIVPPRSILNIYRSIIQPQNDNYYLLALSAYCPNDASLMKVFSNRILKYGYLVPIEKYDVQECLRRKRTEQIEIMWCARFIYWKHPMLVVSLAKRLVQKGYLNFHITMVGAKSNLQDKVNRKIVKYSLRNFITIIPGLPNDEIREMMKRSNIFLVTSDRQEGWGAVLNEAMGASCGIVASNRIGSTPFLIKHGKNGLVFKSGNIGSLYENVIRLINDTTLREKLAEEAYNTISNEWAADNVAQRFIQTCDSIINGNGIIFSEGPCSLAYPCK